MNEFMDRPTLREWRRHVSAQRYQQRLAQAPYYRLKLTGLLIAACAALIGGVILSRP